MVKKRTSNFSPYSSRFDKRYKYCYNTTLNFYEITIMTRNAKDLPSVEFIHECFDYDKDTGICIWKERPLHHYMNASMMNRGNTKLANTIIDQTPHSNGYLYLTLMGVRYSLHRLIWKHVTHNDPVHSIDHIDNNPLNNKWNNLREANVMENNSNRNTQLNSDKKKGVTYRKNTNRYRVQNFWKGHVNCYIFNLFV